MSKLIGTEEGSIEGSIEFLSKDSCHHEFIPHEKILGEEQYSAICHKCRFEPKYIIK